MWKPREGLVPAEPGFRDPRTVARTTKLFTTKLTRKPRVNRAWKTLLPNHIGEMNTK